MTADQFRKIIRQMVEVSGPEKIIEIILESVDYPTLLETVEKQDPERKRRMAVPYSERPEWQKSVVEDLHRLGRTQNGR